MATNRPLAAIDGFALLRPGTDSSVDAPLGAMPAAATSAAAIAMVPTALKTFISRSLHIHSMKVRFEVELASLHVGGDRGRGRSA